MAVDVAAQVSERIATVSQAYARAIAELDSAMWQTAEVKASLDALKGLSGRLDSWAKNGRDGIRSGKPPSGAASWSGWLRSGQIIRDGIATALADGAASETLAAIVEVTVEETKKAPARIAKAAKETGKAIGEVFNEALKPAATTLSMPLLLGAIALVALVVLKGRG